MNNQLNDTATALCVACLSSGRELNLIHDNATKQMFSDILDDFEVSSYTILLCFECVGRIQSILRFRKQVQKAHLILTEWLNHNSQLNSMSRLEIMKTEIFECKPDKENFKIDQFLPDINKEEETIAKHVFLHKEIDNKLYNNVDTFNFDSDNPTSDVRASKKVHKNKNDSKMLNTNLINIWGEVKVENVLNVSENDIKNEPNDAVELVTKCDFSDSDEEPLKTIKAKKKKAKKEAPEKKRERRTGVVSGVWVKKKLQQLNIPSGELVEMVILSWEETDRDGKPSLIIHIGWHLAELKIRMQLYKDHRRRSTKRERYALSQHSLLPIVEIERQKCLSSVSYTRHEFRCSSCVIGFNHRFKLESHMKKHSPEAGDLECNICKTRFKTQGALLCHRRRHNSKWRCAVCYALYSRAAVAADHVARAHGAAAPTHACHVCHDTFSSLAKLRNHITNSHAEKQRCEHCRKICRDKSSLRTHMYIHTNEKDFACSVCDKKFRFKKALDLHEISHRESELLYCAECDVNFKNRLSLYQHINYSMKHIHPDKVKHACEFCPRRFLTATRLQEHQHSRHLHLAPHRCPHPLCTFASPSRPALRTHTRMVHHNKRLERNHVCHTCGKAYTTKKILEGHMRCHTGERPYVCVRCPANFSHAAALYNHNKLVHKIPFVRRKKRVAAIEPANWPVGADPAGKLANDVVSNENDAS